MEIKINNIENIDKAAGEFLAALPTGVRVIDFDGPMGAGKTTFISALCRALGVEDDVNSPTFSIINEYSVPTKTGKDSRVFHFDFYRLETPDQAMEIGAEDYLYSGSLCLMEWAGNVEEVLPEDTLHVQIRPNPDGTRSLLF